MALRNEYESRHHAVSRVLDDRGLKRSGTVFDIQPYSINDGPGIRTTIFFKGCSLRCLWCSNPESQAPWPELLYFEDRCGRCYRCVEACPTRATTIGDGGALNIDRKVCRACGKCAEVCPNGARSIVGKEMTVEDVLAVVKRDSLFFRNSGGGVTLSGGEPAFQPDFALALLQQSRKNGIHTAVETCGYAETAALERLLESVDMVLFDIKHMDPEAHRRLTAADNALILENLKMAATSGADVVVRMPLIPGCNTSPENIRAAGQYVSALGIKRVDVVPYHKLGVSKYARLGRVYQLGHLDALAVGEVDGTMNILRSYGLEARQA